MNLLSRFKISSKLAGMLALSALAVCANIALSTSLSQKRMLDDRVTQLRTAVDHMEVRRFILNGATRAQDHPR
jgi:methyl-accepting chemotaxis protein